MNFKQIFRSFPSNRDQVSVLNYTQEQPSEENSTWTQKFISFSLQKHAIYRHCEGFQAHMTTTLKQSR